MNTQISKVLLIVVLSAILGVSAGAAVGTFTFKTTGASDTVEAVDLVYPQRVPEASSVTTDSLADGSVTPAKLSGPIPVANGGTGATTAAAGLAALGGASLNGSSTVNFSARDTRVYGWNRLASGTFNTADYFNLASGASKTIDFTLVSNVGVACEVSATMQFTSTKQAFGVWYSTFYFTAASGIAGLVHQQTVDLDDSQLLTVAWSWAAPNTLRVTFTNTHTAALFEVTPSIKIISRRAGDMSR